MRPCRFPVGNRDQEILREERMQLKQLMGGAQSWESGGDFSGLGETMESDG